MQKPIEATFDRVVVINLKRRTDRLETFFKELDKAEWCFKRPEIAYAIDGGSGKVPCCDGFEQGGGAWGCQRSHLRVLEDALMDDVKHLLVMEDDCYFRSSFREDVERFLAAVPPDYDGLMLGGQHMGSSAKPVSEGIVRATNCQRTHAYSCKPKYMKALYSHWAGNAKVHCDWIVGKVQEAHKIYAPDPLLIGQDRSQSDICGRTNPRSLWQAPKQNAPVILFRGPRAVIDAMKEDGWHKGYDVDTKTGIDVGLSKICSTGDIKGLRKWLDTLLWEAESIEGVVVVFHPLITAEHIKSVWEGEIHEIETRDIGEAKRQWDKIRNGP